MYNNESRKPKIGFQKKLKIIKSKTLQAQQGCRIPDQYTKIYYMSIKYLWTLWKFKKNEFTIALQNKILRNKLNKETQILHTGNYKFKEGLNKWKDIPPMPFARWLCISQGFSHVTCFG